MRKWFGLAALGFVTSCQCGPPVPLWPVGGGGNFDATVCTAPARAALSLRCVGDAAAPRVALGVCGLLDAENTLTIETTAVTHALAVNGKLVTHSPLKVTGNVTVLDSVETTNTQDVTGVYQAGRDFTLSSPVKVTGDLFVAGALAASNNLNVTGTLHAPAGTSMNNVTAGMFTAGPVSVEKPLACETATRVAALIQKAKDARDAAADPVLPSNALDGITTPTELALGCGRYVFTAAEVKNTLALRITGQTTVVFEGDFRVASPTTITLDEGATLDLVIGGRLLIDNTLTIGRPGAAEATWIAVGKEVKIASPFVLHGVLSAPEAALNGDNTFELNGAALVGSARVASPMEVKPQAVMTNFGCLRP